ncbi:MAG: type 4a pilus biogenesis protein PilO [Deltaproteobacteria bacterium]|nr:type 4a pilus biogenesis protein PilO [Deltaproteobacteria bacterium]
MNRFLEKWLQLPRRRRLLLGGVLLGGTVAIFGMLDLFPLMGNKTQLVQQFQGVQQLYADQKVVTDHWELFRNEFERIDQEFKEALHKLPAEGEIAQLLSDISALAKQSSLDVRSFGPQTEGVKEFYAVLPIQMKVVGNFHDLALFFEKVGQMPRVVHIHDVSIGEVELSKHGYVVSASFIAEAYRFVEEGREEVL